MYYKLWQIISETFGFETFSINILWEKISYIHLQVPYRPGFKGCIYM